MYYFNMEQETLSTDEFEEDFEDPLRDAVDATSKRKKNRISKKELAVILDPLYQLPLKTEQIVATRDSDANLVAPQENDLEQGLRTLAGELTNDAISVLHQDQKLGLYDVKRRLYCATVLAHVTKSVHGSASLRLKASAEKRENAGFLMNLLSKAAAGTLTDEEMKVLKASNA